MKGPNDLKTSFLRLHFHRRQKFSNASIPQIKWVSKFFPSFIISMSSILSNGNPKKGPNNLKTSFLRLHFHWRQRQKKREGRRHQTTMNDIAFSELEDQFQSEINSDCEFIWNKHLYHGLWSIEQVGNTYILCLHRNIS